MKITGTFVNPLSGDIPPTNWVEDDWEKDFKVMSSIGIDTIVLLRVGVEKWMIFDSKVLSDKENCFSPPYDYPEMFLRLCDRHNMKLFMGTYNPHRDWLAASYDVKKEAELSAMLIDEIWSRYGEFDSFGGWYLTQEISSAVSFNIVELFKIAGAHCKAVSGNLPVMISPGMNGIKAANLEYPESARRRLAITLEEHERDWDWIMGEIKGSVDIVAFQDGHVAFDELFDFLSINKRLADKHGLKCWSNVESFDRDVGRGHFPPIRWDKLLMKLEAAEKSGHEKAITFEFTPFMSPNAGMPQAKSLLDRYCEYCGIDKLSSKTGGRCEKD